jgi:hypothetical protein
VWLKVVAVAMVSKRRLAIGLHFDSDYCCPYDKLLCKRVGYDGFPACFTYDVNGRLKFVCKRFVAPAGFVVPKQLSSENCIVVGDVNG